MVFSVFAITVSNTGGVLKRIWGDDLVAISRQIPEGKRRNEMQTPCKQLPFSGLEGIFRGRC